MKLPSKASKHRSGTRANVERQAEKMARAAAVMLARHRADDALAVAPTLRAKDVVRRERLVQDAADNESAKMATSKGVIQGYNNHRPYGPRRARTSRRARRRPPVGDRVVYSTDPQSKFRLFRVSRGSRFGAP